MNHCMTIWTDRYQIIYRVHLILLSDFRQWNHVVYMNIAERQVFPVKIVEIKTTDRALVSEVCQTYRTSRQISFVNVDKYLALSSLKIISANFVRKNELTST